MLVGTSAINHENRLFSWQIPLSATRLTEVSTLNNEFWDGSKDYLWILHCGAGFGSLNMMASADIAYAIRCILLFLVRMRSVEVAVSREIGNGGKRGGRLS